MLGTTSFCMEAIIFHLITGLAFSRKEVSSTKSGGLILNRESVRKTGLFAPAFKGGI